MITGTASLAQLPQHFEAVQHGQHRVQDDQVVTAFQRARQAGAPVMRGIRPEIELAEVVPHQRSQFHVVFDQEERP